MLQRRDLLLAGSETYRKISKLGAPFEPRVSVSASLKISLSSGLIQARSATGSNIPFTYEGETSYIGMLLQTKQTGNSLSFGWEAIFISNNSVKMPTCTIYVLREDTGAIWAFVPRLYIQGDLESSAAVWIAGNRYFAGIPINDACYDGDPQQGNVKDIFSSDDVGKTIDCVFEIYSDYINDRPRPEEPQKYQLYLRWPLNHTQEDGDFYGTGGWVHCSANANNSPAPGIVALGDFDTRICVDDLCCFTFQSNPVLYTLPLQSLWIRNGLGTSILFGPLAGYFSPGAKGPFDKSVIARIYRGDQPDNKVTLSFDITKNMTGGPIYENYGSALPLNKSDINTVIDLYFQYVSSAAL